MRHVSFLRGRVAWVVVGDGGKGIRLKFRNLDMGNRGFKADDDGGPRVVEPEEGYLFSLTSLTPRISFQMEKGV